MEKKLTEEDVKNLVELIVDYLFSEGAVLNLSDDETMEIPARFIFHEYPRDKKQNQWNVGVYHGKDINGRDYSSKYKYPEMAEALRNLSYHDGLELQKALLATGIFRAKLTDYKHPRERADYDEIAHSTAFYTTFGEIKNYSFEKPKSL